MVRNREKVRGQNGCPVVHMRVAPAVSGPWPVRMKFLGHHGIPFPAKDNGLLTTDVPIKSKIQNRKSKIPKTGSFW